MLKDLKVRVGELKDSLAEESHQREALERMATIKLEIKRERSVGRRGGGSKWPVRIVMLICEMLVNGTAPSAVSSNIKSFAGAFGVDVHDEPSINYVRQCRVVVQNLNEMLAAFRLGNAKKWKQCFTDGTSRRQIAFQNLVIGIENGEKFESIIASSCIFLENERAEGQVAAIKDKVCRSGSRVT